MKSLLLYTLFSGLLSAQIVINGGGSGGGFPTVVAAVNYTAQSGNLSFNLLADPVTGDYTLNDILTVTTPDASTHILLSLSWAGDGISESLSTGNAITQITGQQNLAGFLVTGSIGADPVWADDGPLTLASLLHADSGTPVTVAVTVTPSVVGTIQVSSSSGAGGSGYAPGDTGTISAGNNAAIYQVLTVDGDGAVLTAEITAGGAKYTVSTDNPTAVTSGSGDGFLLVDILTLSTALQYSYHATLTRNQ